MTIIYSLAECSNHLVRLWPSVPPEKRPHVSKLAQQCKNFAANPDGLRPQMLRTIGAIEGVAVNAEER